MLSDHAVPQRPPRTGATMPSANGDVSHDSPSGLPPPLIPQRPPPPVGTLANKDEPSSNLISLDDPQHSEESHHMNARPSSPALPNRPMRKAPERPPTSYDKTTANKESIIMRQNLSKISETGKTKKRPEITVVGARPMSEVGFRGIQNNLPSPTVATPEISAMTKSSESSSFPQRPDRPGIPPPSANVPQRPAIVPLPPKRPASSVQVLPSKPSVQRPDHDSALINFDTPLIPSSTSHESFMKQDDRSSDVFRKLHDSNKPFSVQSEQSTGVGRVNISQSFNTLQELNDSSRPVPKPRPRTKPATNVIKSQENSHKVEGVSLRNINNNECKTQSGDNSESIDYRSVLRRDRNNSASKDCDDKVPSKDTCDLILLNFDDDDDGSFKAPPRPSSQIGQRKGPTVIRPASAAHCASEKSDQASLNENNSALKNDEPSSVLRKNPPPALMKKPTIVPKPRNIALPTPPQKPSRIANEDMEEKNVLLDQEKMKRRSLEIEDDDVKDGQRRERIQGLVQDQERRAQTNEEIVSAAAKKPAITRPPRPQHSAFKKTHLASNTKQNDNKVLEPASMNDSASRERDKVTSEKADDCAVIMRPAQAPRPVSDRASIGIKVLPTAPKKPMPQQSHVEGESNNDAGVEKKESDSSDKSDVEVSYKDLREQLNTCSAPPETTETDVKDASKSKSFNFSVEGKRKLFNFKMEPRTNPQSKSTDLDSLSTNNCASRSSWYGDSEQDDGMKPLKPEKKQPTIIDTNLPIQSERKAPDLISHYRDRDVSDTPLVIDMEKSPRSNRAAMSKPERPKNSPPTRPKTSPTSLKDSPPAAEASIETPVDSSPKKPRVLGRMASKKKPEKPPVPRMSSASMKRPSLPSLAPDKPQRLPEGRGTVIHSAGPPVLPDRPRSGHPLYHYMVSGPRGVALFDYNSEAKGDLMFKQGDTISLVEQMDTSWIRGRLGNKEGIFPHSFIEIIEPLPDDRVIMRGHATARMPPDDRLDTPPSKRQSNITTGPRCSARFDYGDDSPEDLIFYEGDMIRIVEQVSDDWLKGEMDGKTGIFPLSFVEVIEDLPAEAAGSSHDWPTLEEPTEDEIPDISKVDLKTTAHAIAVFDFLAPQPGDLKFEEADTILLTERLGDDWLKGYAHGKEGTFPRAFVNVIVDIEDEEAADDKAPKIEHRQARALYDFEGADPSDLSFKAGQLISSVEIVGDGVWSRGEVKGHRGMFPSNFVELI